MTLRLKKILLLCLAFALLTGTSFVQKSLNHDRDVLGLTRTEPLENVPPALAFTTVALGGFRGLISNWLWVRASDLQDQDKFFEMAQLADWITKLEPHYTQVWLHQAWNMAYNISVKFKDPQDRWRWVQRGIELLRDEGLKYNPNDILIYRELAWFFQHKMGANVDDASVYYKQQWANSMAEVFAKKTPDLDELIHPTTDDARRRAELLRDTYKMDPKFMKEVDQRYGPLEWRLPEAHAIYWAALGLDEAQRHPEKINHDDLITLRRVVYQSMLLSFQRGRMESNIFERQFELGPNLAIVPKVNAAYEQAAQEDEKNRDHIEHAHRNFLRDAVYYLYVNNRLADAQKWFAYLREKFPDQPILDDDPNSLPGRLTLDEYAFACVQVEINGSSQAKVKLAIEGLLINSYRNLVLDQDDRAMGLKHLAQQIWNAYRRKIPDDRWPVLGIASIDSENKEVLRQLLDPQTGFPPEIRAALRARLGLPPETQEKKPEPAPGAPGKTNTVNRAAM
jgi:hypothetical protein